MATCVEVGATVDAGADDILHRVRQGHRIGS